MCKACDEISKVSEELTLLVPLLNLNRTDEQILAAIDGIGSFKRQGMTYSDLAEMEIDDLCGVIAVRAARCVSLAIPGKPLSIILGEWAGIAFQQEATHALDEIFGPLGPTAHNHASLN